MNGMRPALSGQSNVFSGPSARHPAAQLGDPQMQASAMAQSRHIRADLRNLLFD
jgi:hypothetical protein